MVGRRLSHFPFSALDHVLQRLKTVVKGTPRAVREVKGPRRPRDVPPSLPLHMASLGDDDSQLDIPSSADYRNSALNFVPPSVRDSIGRRFPQLKMHLEQMGIDGDSHLAKVATEGTLSQATVQKYVRTITKLQQFYQDNGYAEHANFEKAPPHPIPLTVYLNFTSNLRWLDENGQPTNRADKGKKRNLIAVGPDKVPVRCKGRGMGCAALVVNAVSWFNKTRGFAGEYKVDAEGNWSGASNKEDAVISTMKALAKIHKDDGTEKHQGAPFEIEDLLAVRDYAFSKGMEGVELWVATLLLFYLCGRPQILIGANENNDCLRVRDIEPIGEIGLDGTPSLISITVWRGKGKGGRRTFLVSKNEAMSSKALENRRLYSKEQADAAKLFKEQFEGAEKNLCLISNLYFWVVGAGLNPDDPLFPNPKDRSGKGTKGQKRRKVEDVPPGHNPRDVEFKFDMKYGKLAEDIAKLLNEAIPGAKERNSPYTAYSIRRSSAQWASRCGKPYEDVRKYLDHKKSSRHTDEYTHESDMRQQLMVEKYGFDPMPLYIWHNVRSDIRKGTLLPARNAKPTDISGSESE